MESDISSKIKEKAPLILAIIERSNSILLHCHPSPDPDSVGSALAMKFALEQMGKRVTVFRGDSEIPRGFMYFPGADDIVPKHFSEIDLKVHDLFIILDAASPSQISRYADVTFPLAISSVVIDHHNSNTGFADTNLIEPSYPAVSQILFDLFTLWGVKLDKNIAANLFMGIYTDTGGFKYPGTTSRTFDIASALSKVLPEFPILIAEMENSRSTSELKFQAVALNSIETFLNNRFGLAIIPNEALTRSGVQPVDVHGGQISSILRTVVDWKISGVMIEASTNNIKLSFRSSDGESYDVSKLAVALGGGGHKAAAGCTMLMPIAEAKELVVAKAKELYNL